MDIKEKKRRLGRRQKRIRAKIKGTKKVPRLSVYRSLKHIYAQVIDDERGVVLVSASDAEIKPPETSPRPKTKKGKRSLRGKENLAFEVGKLIAAKAKEKKIRKVVFDRGGRAYHGRVKALAEGARLGGLKF